MGQYYKCIILAEKDGKHEYIRTHVNPHSHAEGAKLREHCYCDSKFMEAVESLLRKDGIFYKSRIVWAGDYADAEPGSDKNLYSMIDDKDAGLTLATSGDAQQNQFVINHTKKEYVVKMNAVHPLPILTAEGNGRGGGDYRGSDEHLAGIWARDVISVDNVAPDDYTLLVCNFGE